MLNSFDVQVTHEKTLSNNAFRKLISDINENGIQDPIKYVEGDDGQFYVVDGNHRVMAARQLGITDIPVERVELPYAGYSTQEDLYYYGSNFN